MKQRSAAEDEEQLARAEVELEADVVRVCYTYITHPLVIALNRKYTTPITVKAEEKLDVFQQDFSYNASQNQPTRKMIMIIEFKRIGLIKPAEFTNASKATLQEGRDWLVSEQEDNTLKKGTNVYILTQQAIAYYSNWQCPYVVLCDYDNLVLLQFDTNNDFAYMTSVLRVDTRKALLGFLLEACEFAGIT